ncbi:winged helix-turn-helix domain-containing protein [Pantoea sp. 18069]|uniref:winged helix-turn-helix domain-containing protein n=1 Tax=Pantoea sp. 18069 TaxID=2681415 RepID=UPI00190F94BA|nr:hypothetical protein [Pantoea sp. 18069]
MKKNALFRLRLYRDDVIAIGPGKVQLLEAIQKHKSISAAARSLGSRIGEPGIWSTR